MRPQVLAKKTIRDWRLDIILGAAVFAALVMIIRLFQLQVISHSFYLALASGQRDIYQKLIPERGEIYVRERVNNQIYPVAINRELTTIFADPAAIINPEETVQKLSLILNFDEEEADKILKSLQAKESRYKVIRRSQDKQVVEEIKKLRLSGIYFAPEYQRYYPEPDFGGQVLGFFGYKNNEKTGLYGVEGYWNKELSGEFGYLATEKDVAGRLIGISGRKIKEKINGSDLVLTIERTLQVFACNKLKKWVEEHGAKAGSVVMLDVESGAVLVMCGTPDFNPNKYNEVDDLNVYNNPNIFSPYEPGSVMKPITMAAAIESGKIQPNTTYIDEGEVRIGKHIIKNSDQKAHGEQTMTEVLIHSLNTGAIFAMRQAGQDRFRKTLELFGFGTLTGIELETEVAGDISSLDKRDEIYFATASFGQGITVTTLQLASAFNVLANDGRLMKPYIVDEIKKPDGQIIKTKPQFIRQVISSRTARLLSGMLVSVVERGHGWRAKVPGYFIVGKTGTAQVPIIGGSGYEKDATIGTFAGYAPASNPVFTLVVRIDRPVDVQFAENSAAPLWREIASFALQYLKVVPDDSEG